LRLVPVVRVDVLGHLTLLLLGLSLDLGSGGLRESCWVGAEMVEEVGEARGREKHAGQIRQALVLLDKSAVALAETGYFFVFVVTLTLELRDIF
jgi:hypothetical protein